MTKMIFVNLPVTDLPRSKAFYEAVGFTNNPQFTNDSAAAMVWSEEIVVMLLTHEFWKTFTDKAIPDAHTDRPRSAVPEPRQPGGGRRDRRQGASPPAASRSRRRRRITASCTDSSFEDPDGHIWENVWMDMAESRRRGHAREHVSA